MWFSHQMYIVHNRNFIIYWWVTKFQNLNDLYIYPWLFRRSFTSPLFIAFSTKNCSTLRYIFLLLVSVQLCPSFILVLLLLCMDLLIGKPSSPMPAIVTRMGNLVPWNLFKTRESNQLWDVQPSADLKHHLIYQDLPPIHL